jgi:hypothetical protein
MWEISVFCCHVGWKSALHILYLTQQHLGMWRRVFLFTVCKQYLDRCQWPRGLRRGSAAARLLGLWVRIPPGHGCLSVVSVVCCQVDVSASVWSLVQRSSTECNVLVWSWILDNEEALAHWGLLCHGKKNSISNPKRLRWSRDSVLAFGIQVRGFTPGRSRRIFRAKKSSARLPSERK